MTARFRRLAAALRDLVYPRRAVCMGCGTQIGFEEDWICPECRQELAKSWVGAYPPPKGIEGAAYAYAYRGAAAGIVQHMKYSGIHRLAAFMGGDMARAYRFLEPTGADCVVPVPMHAKRLRQRGYNHAERLARDVAERLGLPCVNALERVRNTVQQARLDEHARRRNLKDAFALRESVAGRRVLLVDDVCTTGTTARTCAKALKAGGAKSVYLLCYTVALPKKGGK